MVASHPKDMLFHDVRSHLERIFAYIQAMGLRNAVIFAVGATIGTSVVGKWTAKAFLAAAVVIISAISSVLQLVIAICLMLHSCRARQNPTIATGAAVFAKWGSGELCRSEARR